MSERTYNVLTGLDGKPVVLEVHDGDTVRLLLDDGFETGSFPWLRLKGCNAPELKTRDASDRLVANPQGIAARVFVLGLLTTAKAIVVTTTKAQGQSFARYVAQVSVDGQDLTKLMIDSGHAVAM